MKYELALVSPVFFLFPIGVLFGWIINSIIALLGREIPTDSSLTFFLPLVIIIAISFIGSILLLITARNNSSRYYWLIPLCMTLFGVIVAGVVTFFELFSGDTSILFIGIALLMLVPCSIPVFLSLPISSKVRSIALALTTGFSIYSITVTIVIIAKFIIFGEADFELEVVYLAIYWMFLMPIIGLCYLACAFVSPKTASIS